MIVVALKWAAIAAILALVVGAIAWYDEAHNRRDEEDQSGWGV